MTYRMALAMDSPYGQFRTACDKAGKDPFQGTGVLYGRGESDEEFLIWLVAKNMCSGMERWYFPDTTSAVPICPG